MKQKLPERRQFVRVDVPLRAVIETGGVKYEILTKNISPVGLRFEIPEELDEGADLSISLFLLKREDPILLKGRVVWKQKVSLEDNAPYDTGIEITEINEEYKIVFLKYLCDLLYGSAYKART